MPDEPAIPQKVKFFTAKDTLIAEELPITVISAIKFDEFIAPLFKDIREIDREKWELADRLWAINSALAQQQQRRENEQVYLRLDAMPDGTFLLTIVHPQGGLTQ